MCVDVSVWRREGGLKQEAMTWNRTDMSYHRNWPSWFSTEHERVHQLFVGLLLLLPLLLLLINITGVVFGSLCHQLLPGWHFRH